MDFPADQRVALDLYGEMHDWLRDNDITHLESDSLLHYDTEKTVCFWFRHFPHAAMFKLRFEG